jgi:integrase
MNQKIAEASGMWKVLYATAVETGARAGELYALEVPDIDFVRNVIHIRRAVWEGRDNPPTRAARPERLMFSLR